ncbi:SPOR domain-containing protein [Vogesella sp. DC21W]|uniref:SPOR domain-containing protein n=1 Tax=Vogesella aquatica TaxID=2984206 RepID=A0ABT5IVH6_9NEIS|nr:SPOR domain-containing protein [Vogesella aquatica]MDC7716196.1 SPOR domain-containing protein [Vogesella aquatica]
MKWFIGTLVVVNLLAALYGALKQKPEVDIHAQEVNAAQLKMLPANWKPSLASAPEASAPATDIASSMPQAESMPAVPAVTSATATVAAPKETKPAVLAAKPEAKVQEAKAEDKAVKPAETKVADAKPAAATLCYSWGGLDPQQLARVQGGVPLLKLSSPPQASVEDQRRGSGKTWVFYPPLATQAETQTLVAELKAKGFDSYIVQTAGEFKGHLSLGLFGREEGAQALVKRLKAAGYDKAKVDSRGDVVKVTTLSFRQLDEATASKLKALQKRLLPGIPVQACR